VFLLNKQGYLLDTGVLTLLLPIEMCYPASVVFIFDILWQDSWLCPCFFLHNQCSDIGSFLTAQQVTIPQNEKQQIALKQEHQ
jgi:hypothetical protein